MNESKQIVQTLRRNDATQEQTLLALQQLQQILQYQEFEMLSETLREENLSTMQLMAILDLHIEKQHERLINSLDAFNNMQKRNKAQLQSLLITAAIIATLLSIGLSLIMTYGLAAQFLMLGSNIFSMNYLNGLYYLFSTSLIVPTYQAFWMYAFITLGLGALYEQINKNHHLKNPLLEDIIIGALIIAYISLEVTYTHLQYNIAAIPFLNPSLWALITSVASAGLYISIIPATAVGLYFLTTNLHQLVFDKLSAYQATDAHSLENENKKPPSNGDDKATINEIISDLKITKETVKHTMKLGLFAVGTAEHAANGQRYYPETHLLTDPAFLVPPQMMVENTQPTAF